MHAAHYKQNTSLGARAVPKHGMQTATCGRPSARGMLPLLMLSLLFFFPPAATAPAVRPPSPVRRPQARSKPTGPSYPAYVIVLHPERYDPAPLAGLSSVSNLTVVQASNGTEAGLDLPLVTRHVIRRGRSDHVQIGNTAALGCLLSHQRVWAAVAAGTGPALVFEEDAQVSVDSDFKLARFLRYFESYGPGWDILMLDPGHLNIGGQSGPVGPYAANCTEPHGCTWFGTRAYAVRPAAAALLLEHSFPITVQVDAVVSLVAEFYAKPPERFRMYWTRGPILGYDLLRRSTVFDWCVKCYLPTEVAAYVAAVSLLIAPFLGYLYHARGA
jgi:hypothetical protein